MLNQKFGALWKKTAKTTGQTFYSGQIDTPFGHVQISVFKNDKKEKDNQPDLNIVFNGCKPYENRDRPATSKEDDIFDQQFDQGIADDIPEDVFNDEPKVEGKGVDLDTIQL